MTILDLFLLLCCSTACCQLIFYRRNGASFKRHISFIAWLAIVLTGSVSLLLITGDISARHLNPIIYLLLVIIAIVVIIARGNVAEIIRKTRSLV